MSVKKKAALTLYRAAQKTARCILAYAFFTTNIRRLEYVSRELSVTGKLTLLLEG